MFLTLMSCLVIGAPVTISNTYDVLGRNEVSNAVFLSFARITWGLAISWIIFSCQCGLNKHLNRFLSWKFWIPIGRMGLSIYLIHPVLQFNFVIWQGEKVSLEIGQMVSCCRKVLTISSFYPFLTLTAYQLSHRTCNYGTVCCHNFPNCRRTFFINRQIHYTQHQQQITSEGC